MEKDALYYGAVIFTAGKRKGQLGYYDDESDSGNRAIVYLGQPFQSEYVEVPYSSIRNINSAEHTKFKLEFPELCRALGVD